MEIQIGKLNKYEANTRYGKKYIWKFPGNDGKYYQSWVGKWNENWEEGMIIEVPDYRLKPQEYNGKTTYNIDAPPKMEQGGGGGGQPTDLSPIMTELSMVKAAIKIMDGRLKTLLENQEKTLNFFVQRETKPKNDTEFSPPDDDSNDDIPWEEGDMP